jgi:hypothetical protein
MFVQKKTADDNHSDDRIVKRFKELFALGCTGAGDRCGCCGGFSNLQKKQDDEREEENDEQ